MSLAIQLAKNSSAHDRQIGCVIVTTDDRSILGIGYNGTPPGTPNRATPDGDSSGYIHAEVNAVNDVRVLDARPRKAYITLSPCKNCASLLADYNIEEVIYLEKHSKLEGLAELDKDEISHRQYLRD